MPWLAVARIGLVELLLILAFLLVPVALVALVVWIAKQARRRDDA